jgi:hypothetical protein
MQFLLPVLVVATTAGVCTSVGLKINPSKVLPPKTSSGSITDKQKLIKALDGLDFGLKETERDSVQIQSLISVLKDSKKKISNPALAFAPTTNTNTGRRIDLGAPKKSSQKKILEGKWNLLYTNAPDVLQIEKIPGVKLTYVGQEVDTDANTITNIIYADGPLSSKQEVYVGIRQVSPTRVELDFLGTQIKLLKIFGRENFLGIDVNKLKPFYVKFKKENIEKALKGKPAPAFELEYLDEDLRIHRTAEGYTFVIQKDMSSASQINDRQEVSLLRDGIGPWLTSILGEGGMQALGLISLTPYLMFFYLFVQKLAVGGSQ